MKEGEKIGSIKACGILGVLLLSPEMLHIV